MENFRIVILAAGKGKRMNFNLPKTLIPISGKPILQRLMESVNASKVDGVPVVVVGHEREQVCESFQGSCEYVVQEEQLGTGHAVMCCRGALLGTQNVIVLYGDHPFISAPTIQRLAGLHTNSGGVMTMMTTVVPSFDDWYHVFSHWGRILRDAHGHLLGIRQFKDAMESERNICEVDPALYCFQASWLWENIHQLKNFNAQREYYLTDMLELAVTQKHDIASLQVPPEEAVGVNTAEELAVAEQIFQTHHVTS
jgi:bifunctional UDP-N-acetylglucosamine pyrophosphorylase/glucosamine-1-phosphate N-acetyltransferase